MSVSKEVIERLVKKGIEKARERFSNSNLSSTGYAKEVGREDGLEEFALDLKKETGIDVNFEVPYPNSQKSS